ncbi:YdgA family protein [Providencia stuartii]|nr:MULTISPECIES: YdgA family protein [Providencia]ELR5111263.1 YdgA family protein [Providencia stuartii]ELR5298581.1 YdgA family protein [Providencia stuartii]MDW7587028.1 YdgA family protein [Providencia sp. 2023EL-00965]QQO60660.1 YdgA family protein [Providencia manganoxydans]
MKKSLVAVGVIVAVGAAWTGASWYTGSKVENELNKIISNTNEFFAANAPEAGVVFKVENFKRGVFSSQANIVISAAESNGADETIVFNTDIEHGPFPLSQVAKFNLIPKLGAANIELANNAATKELFEITKGKPFISGTAVVGYSKSIDSNLELLPIEYSKDDASISFSGSKLVFNSSADFADVDGSIITDNLVIQKADKSESMTLKGLKITTNVTKSQYGFYTGKQDLVIADTDFNIPETKFSFKNLVIGSDTVLEKESVKGSISYSIDDLKALEQNLGSGKVALSIDKLDAKALGKFVEQYNKALAEGLATGDPSAAAEQVAMDMMTKTLPELLQSKPTFSISPAYWKNDAGQSSIDLSMTFNKWDQDELTSLAMANKVDEAVKSLLTSFDFNFTLNKPMAIELIAQAAILDQGKAVDAATKKQFVEQATAEFDQAQVMLTSDMFSSPFEEMFMTDEQRAEKAKQKKSPWMVEKGNDLTMTIKFAGNDITFNADKYTLADFLTKMKVMSSPEDNMGYEEDLAEPEMGTEEAPAEGADIAVPAAN